MPTCAVRCVCVLVKRIVMNKMTPGGWRFFGVSSEDVLGLNNTIQPVFVLKVQNEIYATHVTPIIFRTHRQKNIFHLWLRRERKNKS